jgi:hypothetical protein
MGKMKIIQEIRDMLTKIGEDLKQYTPKSKALELRKSLKEIKTKLSEINENNKTHR